MFHADLLSGSELALAATKKQFVDDEVYRLDSDALKKRLEAVLDSGERASVYAYYHAAQGRRDILTMEPGRSREGYTSDLDETLEAMHRRLAGPERLKRVERARATLEETELLQMRAGYARRGVRSPAEAAASRHLSSVGEVA